jgi:hypothetical protein
MTTLLILLSLAIFILVFGYLGKIAILGFRCKTRPKVGQQWVWKENAKNPWSTSENFVTITAIEKGWVKFDRSFIKGDTAKLDTFVRLCSYVKD